MGSNKRYADGVAARSTVAMYARIAAAGVPESLTDLEVDRANDEFTRSPIDRPVIAWVRYGREPVRVRAIARAWTSKAVAISWPAPGGGMHQAWVWAGAIIEWLAVDRSHDRVPVLGDEP